MTTQNIITCPNCGTQINIEEALYTQLQKKFNADMKQERKKYKEAMELLHTKEQNLKDQQAEFDKKLSDALIQQLQIEKLKLQEGMGKEIKANEGDILLQVLLNNGIEVPISVIMNRLELMETVVCA